jgi:hypothetical protein
MSINQRTPAGREVSYDFLAEKHLEINKIEWFFRCMKYIGPLLKIILLEPVKISAGAIGSKGLID